MESGKDKSYIDVYLFFVMNVLVFRYSTPSCESGATASDGECVYVSIHFMATFKERLVFRTWRGPTLKLMLVLSYCWES